MASADTCNGAADDTETEFWTTGEPETPGTNGTRFFAVDHTGMIRQKADDVFADMTEGVPLQ